MYMILSVVWKWSFKKGCWNVYLTKGYLDHSNENSGVDCAKTEISTDLEQTAVHDVNVFTEWLYNRNVSNFEDLEDTDKTTYLIQFYGDRLSSGESDLDSLQSIHNSLIQHLSVLYETDVVMTSQRLEAAADFLKTCSSGKKSSKGARKHPMTKEDLLKLHSSGLMSPDHPMGLLRKVWFDITVHLGCCGQDAMRQLHADSFLLEMDEHGRRYFRLNPDIDCDGERCRHEVQCWNWNGRMYEIIGDVNCPVRSLNIYLGKRNTDIPAFFQRPRQSVGPHDKFWYEASPLGHCALAKIVSSMSTEAHLSKVYTNTSIRLGAADLIDENSLNVYRLLGVHPRFRLAKACRYNPQDVPSDTLFKNSNILHELMYNLKLSQRMTKRV